MIGGDVATRRNKVNEIRAHRVRRLIEALTTGDVPETAELTVATEVPGWTVIRVGLRTPTLYAVTPPECRSEAVPWAEPPSKWELTREQTVEVLREAWIPDALRFVEILTHAEAPKES